MHTLSVARASSARQIRRVDPSVGGAGVIVAQGGSLSALMQIAVVPSAVPEPGAAALLGLGLLAGRGGWDAAQARRYASGRRSSGMSGTSSRKTPRMSR